MRSIRDTYTNNTGLIHQKYRLTYTNNTALKTSSFFNMETLDTEIPPMTTVDLQHVYRDTTNANFSKTKNVQRI
jgi:hypothetical protein